jgi:hypothetical protein
LPVKQDCAADLVADATLEDPRQAIVLHTTVGRKLVNICGGEHPVQQPRVDQHEIDLAGYTRSN